MLTDFGQQCLLLVT